MIWNITKYSYFLYQVFIITHVFTFGVMLIICLLFCNNVCTKANRRMVEVSYFPFHCGNFVNHYPTTIFHSNPRKNVGTWVLVKAFSSSFNCYSSIEWDIHFGAPQQAISKLYMASRARFTNISCIGITLVYIYINLWSISACSAMWTP